MNQREMQDVMVFIFADHDHVISDEKRTVWFTQFHHLPLDVAMKAAIVLVGRKTYGLPRVHDFAQAVADVTSEGSMEWPEAWELWRRMGKGGIYNWPRGFNEYQEICPIGAMALGGKEGARDWAVIEESDVPTFRANFRMGYERLLARERQDALISPDARKAITSTQIQLSNKNFIQSLLKKIEGPAQ
jgi:hypothetical protein